MVKRNDNEQQINKIKGVLGKWLPDDVCAGVINFCTTSELQFATDVIKGFETGVRRYLESVTVDRIAPADGYEIYKPEALKRIYIALYNLTHSREALASLKQLAPENDVESFAWELYDEAAEELLRKYLIDDGYILYAQDGAGTYFDHIKLIQPDVVGSGSREGM